MLKRKTMKLCNGLVRRLVARIGATWQRVTPYGGAGCPKAIIGGGQGGKVPCARPISNTMRGDGRCDKFY
jgi:hypothetical protein